MLFKKITLSLLIIFFSHSASYAQTSTAPSGAGTSANPYLITSLDNLYWMAVNHVAGGSWSNGKYFSQINDIDASATATWTNNWIPIGGRTSITPSSVSSTESADYAFNGNYNGNGFTISGITYNNTFSANNLNGFFGEVRNSGVILNLKLTNLSITTNSQKTGGLVGHLNTSSIIYNCSTSGTITSTSNTVGGLVGQNQGTIFNSYSTCSVTGFKDAIGILNGLNQATIYDCYANGSATGTETGSYVGGLIGELSSSNLFRSYANSTITVPASSYGAGFASYLRVGVPSNNYWNSTLFGSGYGFLNGKTFSATGRSTAQLKVAANFNTWDFVNTWVLGSDGFPTHLNKPNTWLGVNTNWADAANWSLGVPISNNFIAFTSPSNPSSSVPYNAMNMVYIPAGLSNYPVLTANATAYTVTLAKGASINLGIYSLTRSFYFEQGSTWTGATSTAWNVASNWNPQVVPVATSEVYIPNLTNDPISSGNITLAKLTLDAGATLSIAPTHALKVNGDIINNGQIIFKSDVTGSGNFDVFSGSISGTGNAQVERYIPAKRAYRFLSSSVTTTTSIKQNWQENGGSAAGLGTHITGSAGATNGFDATLTNNPSMFSFNSTNEEWIVLTSTLTNTLTAGTPYRMLVRGDRSTDLTSNTATASTTTLRATGALKTGNFTPTLNQGEYGYSFVGNPYQATVDFKAVLAASTNLNKNVVYYWDPTLNTRGAYVTRNLDVNTNDVVSNFNQYLQPGQAVFIIKENTANAPSLTFTESHKSVGNAAAGVFRDATNIGTGLLRINLKALIDSQWTNIEGALAIFNNKYAWAITSDDAMKMTNLDEELSFIQDNASLAIATQPNPASINELPIKLSKTRQTNYQWQFELTNYNGLTPYLFDNQNNTYTQIANQTAIPFIVNGQEQNRFSIVFQNAMLGVNDLKNQISLYPNPAKADASFYLTGISNAKVTLINLLGQQIPIAIATEGTITKVKPLLTLSQGVYVVSILQNGKAANLKWVVE
jgi:hypothetical protein